MSSKRPTLRDVAREAGLSVTQTSRALNGHSDVAAATRDRAEAAARAIGYAPNLEARRLKMPDTRAQTIGLVLDTTSQRFSDPFLGDLLTAMVDETRSIDYELQLSSPPTDEHLDGYVNAIRQKRVDGFVVLRVATDDDRIAYLLDRGFPFVTFGRPQTDHPGAETISSVTEDDACIQPAVDHLVALGHTRIGCVYVPLGYAISDHRLASFHRAMAAHGLEAAAEHVGGAGFHEDVGFEIVRTMLSGGNPPTAIVAFNDLLALGAMRAAAERGLSVPEDLSIIGFDDVMASRFLSPPLTSLRNSPDTIGRLLIRRLTSRIDDPEDVGIDTVPTELVVRSSTAPPPESGLS